MILLAAEASSSYDPRPQTRKRPPSRSGPKSREETPKKGSGIATPSPSRSANLGAFAAVHNHAGLQQPRNLAAHSRSGALSHHGSATRAIGLGA